MMYIMNKIHIMSKTTMFERPMGLAICRTVGIQKHQL